jgi:uroporphyrinogen-III synthase
LGINCLRSSSKSPLKNILITRPLSSSQLLAEKIRSHGFNPIVFPVIEIVEISDVILPDLSRIDIIIFISPTAVDEFAKRNWIPVFTGMTKRVEKITIFAVGKDTAQKIQQKNLGNAIYPLEKFGAEGVVELPELKEVKNKNILICKGINGNPLIKDTLKKRGGKVKEISLYETRIPTGRAPLPDLELIDLIICTSGESLRNLITLFGDRIKEKHLLVSSEKLKLLAEQLQFKCTPSVAKNAGVDALLEALKFERLPIK